jgi:hypothetical protein
MESSGNKTLMRKLKQLETSNKIHYVEHGYKNQVIAYDGSIPSTKELEKLVGKGIGLGTSTLYNFSKEDKENFQEVEGVPDSNFSTVAHELQHQYDFDQGNNADSQNIDSSSKDPAEIRAVFFENLVRKIDSKLKRERYGGDLIEKAKLDNPPNNN